MYSGSSAGNTAVVSPDQLLPRPDRRCSTQFVQIDVLKADPTFTLESNQSLDIANRLGHLWVMREHRGPRYVTVECDGDPHGIILLH
jgi:hypothetical protein